VEGVFDAARIGRFTRHYLLRQSAMTIRDRFDVMHAASPSATPSPRWANSIRRTSMASSRGGRWCGRLG